MKKTITIALLLISAAVITVFCVGTSAGAINLDIIVRPSFSIHTYDPVTAKIDLDPANPDIDVPKPGGPLRGDANLDGKVLANDARIVLRASASIQTLKGPGFTNCDLNADGRLLANEARKILRYSAQLERTI